MKCDGPFKMAAMQAVLQFMNVRVMKFQTNKRDTGIRKS